MDPRDLLLAVFLSVAFQIELWLRIWTPLDEAEPGPTGSGRLLAAGIGLALTMSVAWRQRYPLIGLGLALPILVVTGPGGIDGTPALSVTLIVVLFSVGRCTRDSSALIGAAGVGGMIAVAVIRDPDARLDLGDFLQPVLILGGAWLAGLALRIRHDRERALEQRAADLEVERDARAVAAIADERARIAREVHDIVAHSIGVIVLQARGGRASLAADPAATRGALDAIETTGVQAINEMHRLVTVLRVDDDPASLVPPPGLRDLDQLLARIRDAGLPVELVVEGTPVDLAPGVDLSAYRIVQEALTNALRHAGASGARVRIGYGERELKIEISDGGGRPAAIGTEGLGLVGMRERAALVGGRLEAEPRSGGGFVVRARLPTEQSSP